MIRQLFLASLLLVTIYTSTFAANQQYRNPILIGFFPAAPSTGTSTLTVNAAAGAGGWGLSYSQTGLAYSFISTGTQQISKIKVYASAVNGTLSATDLVADLYSDTSGVPGTSIESRTSVTATPTGAAWVEFTGFTATSTLVAGTQYWIVLRNADATPTINYPTYRWGATTTAPAIVNGDLNTWGFNKVATTDGGATWASAATKNIAGWRIEFSDGTFVGIPISNVAVSGTADYIYSTREVGARLTTPANASINVNGVMFSVAKIGTVTQALRYRLYTGDSATSGATPVRQGTTGDVPIANLSTSRAWAVARFSSPITIAGSTVVRVVVAQDGAGGDTSNAYRVDLYTIDNTAGSKALMCYAAAGCSKTVSTDGTTFTDTDTETPAFGLLLDTNGEFTNTGAGIVGVIGG